VTLRDADQQREEDARADARCGQCDRHLIYRERGLCAACRLENDWDAGGEA